MKSKSNDNTNRNTRRLLVLIAVGSILLVVPIVSLFVDPQYQMMIYMTRIVVGSKFYDILARENPGTLLQVFVFNVTNAEAFLSGDEHKLRLEEVGPFTYQEYRSNEKFEVDEEAGVMRYKPYTRTEFRPELSIDDPELVNITVPNSALLAISSMLSSYPYWTKAGFSILADQVHSKPIINTDVHSVLWGYDEPLISLSNTLMPGWITFSKMGILDRLYDQSSSPMLEVSTGTQDKFQVKKIDGSPGLNMWGYDDQSKRTRCNTLVDTYEGFGYAPRLTPDDSIRLYRSNFCRMLDLSYIGTTTTEVTSEAFVYQISNKSYSIDPSTKCLCGKSSECIDGISDISPCLFGLSIGLSNGHFLYANPEVYDRIDGMRPDEKEHGSEFIVEPKVGAVLSGRFTVQVNVIVKHVDFYSRVRPFSKMVVPLTYFKIIQPELNKDDKNDIKMSNYLLPYIFHGVELVIFVVGLSILAYALHQMYLQWLYFGIHENDENHKSNHQVETSIINEKCPTLEIRKSQSEICSSVS